VNPSESCQGTCSERAQGRVRRAERALRADTGRVLRPARPVVGQAAQVCSALWLGRDRPSVRCAHGPSSVLAQKPFKNKKFLFYFLFGFKLNSNFKNLYLNI
jgi:hypothetical protein